MEAAEESEAYPRPPHYYKLFAKSSKALLPPTLDQTSFTCFGVKYPLPDTLEDYNIPRLDKSFDPERTLPFKEKLLHLLDSLMASSFQLLRFLEVCPEKVQEKVGDIDLIVRNMLFLLNACRRKQCLYDLLEDINKKSEQRAAVKEELKNILVSTKSILDELNSGDKESFA
eukprot:TRINITY_DN2569_c0_g4_i1.p1 TRINITY_DN2569_c0_g4~~TRINITY_DN2569_c0_g4_i1.p1  ORF type:complete len:171 (-),score=59.12 TRINITY_DN2569_c0_g4_i1:112-624(-)